MGDHMNNEKILKIVIALLSVFVIAAGIYLIIDEPGEEVITADKEQVTSVNETSAEDIQASEQPMTSANNENENQNEEAAIDELFSAIFGGQSYNPSSAASYVYFDAEEFSDKCDSYFVDIPTAPYKGEIKEKRDEEPEIRYDTDYTIAGIELLLSQYLEAHAYEYGAYVVAFGENETPVSVYFAKNLDSGYIGVYGDELVDTDKFTTINAIYDELLRMYETEPETFDNREDYDSFNSDFGNTDNDENASSGNTMTIMTAYGSSFESDMDRYYFDHKNLPDGVSIDYTYEDTDEYEDTLTDDLFGNELEFFSTDYNVDLLILDPYVAADLLNSDLILPLSELGFTEAELADQFPFTVSLTSDDNGVQKGLMYKLYPEVFIYRKSIAKKVLGTDDPKEVAEFIKDRNSFEATAEKMKENGYKMLGGTDEEAMMFTQYDRTPIVYENGDFVIPKYWKNWAEHTKNYVDKGYVLTASMWSDEWSAALEHNEFFGIFDTSWYTEDLLWMYPGYDDDWAACPGPVGAYSDDNMSGHSFIICAAKGTDNRELAADIMRTLTLDKENLKLMAQNEDVLTNTVSGMTEIAEGKYVGNFGGGYNPFWAYTEAAKKIGEVKTNSEPYLNILSLYMNSMENYLTGSDTYDECVTLFQSELKEYWFYP
jgi:hypothetical protein